MRKYCYFRAIIIIIIIERKDLGGVMSKDCKDTLQTLKTVSNVNLSLGRLPGRDWKRCPGRPNNRWVDQVLNDTGNMPSTYGDQPFFVAMAQEWCNDPSWLREHDDDND